MVNFDKLIKILQIITNHWNKKEQHCYEKG